MSQRKLSIVVPVYNEEESLRPLYAEIMKYLPDLNDLIDDYELLFVDDGSSDTSVQVIRELAREDEHIRGIFFRKNFGKAAALQAAFRAAEGDIVITMDADLQDDPRELRSFVEKIDEGYDLVSGWKFNRLDPLEKRLPSKLFNRVTCKMSGIELHDFNCGFKAYRKEVVKAIDVYGEYHRYIPVLAHRKGFRIAELKVHHNKRQFGKSKYGFERYLRGLFDSMSSSFLLRYYDRPMYFFGKNGLKLCGIGMVLMMAQIILWLAGRSLMIDTWLRIGVICVGFGFMSFMMGYIANMVIDSAYRNDYSETHVRERI